MAAQVLAAEEGGNRSILPGHRRLHDFLLRHQLL